MTKPLKQKKHRCRVMERATKSQLKPRCFNDIRKGDTATFKFQSNYSIGDVVNYNYKQKAV